MELTQNRISNATQKMKEGVLELGNVMIDKSGDIKDAAMDKGRAALDKGVELKDAAFEKGRAAYDAGKQKALEYHAQGADTIRANPYSSVLYAFGVGALIGGLAIYLASSKDSTCDK